MDKNIYEFKKLLNMKLIICTNLQSENLNLTAKFFQSVQSLSFRAYSIEAMAILQFALEN